MSTPPLHTNRLIHESSPYLLQHAHNPVDWYPWGEEAFEAARTQEKPIFLSVGYSACHWCHVMEHESFENEEIAALLNERFICVKVDREERPDIDQIYMSAVQLLTQRGGWPMSVFLTPDGRPYYGGTYWPPAARMGMPGFRDVVVRLYEYWTDKRDEVETSATSLVNGMSRMLTMGLPEESLDVELMQHAADALRESADRRHGGFGGAPKFPHPMDIRLLLRSWHRSGKQDLLDIAELTLQKMADGGIYDHLGGGFHRYSTDAVWLAPHFEKMLYDNALLIPAYVEAYQITGKPTYLRTVTETLKYVLKEMQSEAGGYFSTQDADSEGVEGKFFVWTETEIVELLGEESARLFCACYNVTPQGNWEGHTILNRTHRPDDIATRLGVEAGGLEATLAHCRQQLLHARAQRVHPGRDEKVLVNWNGLMIAAMAIAARTLHVAGCAESTALEQQCIASATAAAQFILKQMRDSEGRLLHSYKDGTARFNAYLDDYACLTDGLIELYLTTFDPQWIEAATELAEQMIQRFTDVEQGGFFYTSHDHETLISRPRELQDSATPSGNSMAATALIKLAKITGRADFEAAGYGTLQMMSGLLNQHPRASAQAFLALDLLLGPTQEAVITDGSQPEVADQMLQELWTGFRPRVLTMRQPAVKDTSPITSETDLPAVLRPLFTDRFSTTTAAAYICEEGACQLPVHTANKLSGVGQQSK